MLFKPARSCLLIIDAQPKLLNKIKDKGLVVKTIIKIIEIFKTFEKPVIVSEQYPKGLGKTVKKISDNLPSNCFNFEKTVFSCFKSPIFVKHLTKFKIKTVVICGIESHICVLQTALDLKHQGYEPFVIIEGINSRNTNDKENALKRLEKENINLLTFEMLLFEFIEDSKNPKFKKIIKLIT